MVRFIALFSAWLLLLQLSTNVPTSKPTLVPFFSRVDEAPAFFVECRNNTTTAIPSNSDVWPWASGRLRIDGQPFVDRGGVIGPGLSSAIEPGGMWRGIYPLRQSREGYNAPTNFGANVRSGVIVPLIPGRHTIAVKCGETWSDGYAFYWEDASARTR